MHIQYTVTGNTCTYIYFCEPHVNKNVNHIHVNHAHAHRHEKTCVVH